MKYAKIIPYDIANGEGVRTSLFVSGCTNNCPGCFNPEQQDFGYGTPYSYDTFFTIVKLLKNPVISGLSILGGDPLCQDQMGMPHKIILNYCWRSTYRLRTTSCCTTGGKSIIKQR